MRRLRTTSTRRLLTFVACGVVLLTSAAIAQAALTGSGPIPAPKALAQAIKDAINAPSPDGLTARITFKNNLLPSGSLPGTSNALTSGADGRLWLTKDGRLRLELQSDSGDAQITSDGKTVSLYDSASNTVYKATLPEEEKPNSAVSKQHYNPTIAKIQSALDRLAKYWTVSGATPTSTAGQPTYTVRVSPKDDGGLLGAAKLAWDSVTGAPLRAAVYAQGQETPVLELKATEVDYGPVSDDAVKVAVPENAKVVTLGDDDAADHATGAKQHGKHDVVSGADAVAKQLDFALAAPAELAGLPRKGVHLVKTDDAKGALVTYGEGLGAIVVFQHKVDPNAKADDEKRGGGFHGGGKSPLPEINIDGTTGTELATALGTVVSFERGGVTYLVAGSVPPVAAENAARGLK